MKPDITFSTNKEDRSIQVAHVVELCRYPFLFFSCECYLVTKFTKFCSNCSSVSEHPHATKATKKKKKNTKTSQTTSLFTLAIKIAIVTK